MAKKKNTKSLLVSEPIVDPSFKDLFMYKLNPNKFVDVAVSLTMSGAVTNESAESYIPEAGLITIYCPALNKKYNLYGEFSEVPDGGDE